MKFRMTLLAATVLAAPFALPSLAQAQPVTGPYVAGGIGYNIDELADGTKVAQIDSVGSQANRMEPLFKEASPGRAAPRPTRRIS